MSNKDIDSIWFCPVGTNITLKIKRGNQILERKIIFEKLL